ncbi:MAG: hypothetical protein Q9168_006879 [Polycauliona sp. 1 TL-2023]
MTLVGTCLLIPPFPITKRPTGGRPSRKELQRHKNKNFWIACLFTSSGFGKNVDTPDAILQNTARAMRDLKTQIEEMEPKVEKRGGCYGVRINSGLFNVPWQDTKKVLRDGGVDMVVVRPESQRDEVVGNNDDEGGVAMPGVQKESIGVQRMVGAADATEEKLEVSGAKSDVGAVDKGSINQGLKRNDEEDDKAEVEMLEVRKESAGAENLVTVDGTEEKLEVSGAKPHAEMADGEDANKGLKRKNEEDGDNEESAKKRSGEGRRTKRVASTFIW